MDPKPHLQTSPASTSFSLQTVGEAPVSDDFGRAFADGLGSSPKTLPCRFFYDERGSELFEQITELAEYYPTRVELEILQARAREIARSFDTAPELIELGSGSAAKTRVLIRELLEAHGSLRFRPIDISPSILEQSCPGLLADHPQLTIDAIAGEYEEGLRNVDADPSSRPRLIAWLGSSIGNLSRLEAAEFLGRLRKSLRTQDRLLVGIDRRKDVKTLLAAYDDAAGVTAEFNLNLLRRANRELGARFDLDQFEHRAVWREEAGRIEMHLVSRTRQSVPIEQLGAHFDFGPGETIHTENSHKYSRAEIDDLADRAGLTRESYWTDGEEQFELSWLRPNA